MFNGLVPFGRTAKEMESFLERMLQEDFGFSALSTGMRVDIQENAQEYVVEAEIPGASKEQIHINYDHNYLTIAVENVMEVNEEKANFIRRERKVGKTSRSFYVENVRSEDIQAQYDNGVLKVFLPKNGNKKVTRKIQIQ